MEFFNKKEDVLDVQLTEYGKYLLSQGRMKPAYYAFFDDEVLYDLSASGDQNEAQKDVDRRIRYETPNLRPQSNTTGVETRVRQFQKAVQKNANKKALTVNSIDFADAFENVPHFDQKFFVATDPLGSSDLKSTYDPAWGVNLLHNEISSSTDYYTVNLTSSAATLNNGVIKEIPQINITLDYKTFYTKNTMAGPDFEILASLNAEGINLALEKNYILIDVQEHNTNYEKENFYIEVFESGSDDMLKQMCFTKGFKKPDADSADSYLDLSTDWEIPGPSITRQFCIDENTINNNGPTCQDPYGDSSAGFAATRGGGGDDDQRFEIETGPQIYSTEEDSTKDEEPCD
jgi:hypothetical protein